MITVMKSLRTFLIALSVGWLLSLQVAPAFWHGVAVSLSGRTLLSANADVYINASTGNNANPCTSAQPCQTLQYVWNNSSNTLDGGGNVLTIHAKGAGPYTLVAQSSSSPWVGFSIIIIVGDGSSTTILDDVNLNTPNGLGTSILFDAMTLKDTGSGSCLNVVGNQSVGIGFVSGDMAFVGLGATLMLQSSNGGRISTGGNIAVSTLDGSHLLTSLFAPTHGGQISNGATITFSGSPYFNDGIANSIPGGLFEDSGTYSGSVGTPTQPFVAGLGGIILTPSANPTYIPGDQPGIIFPDGVLADNIGDGVFTKQQVFTPSSGGTVAVTLLKPNALIKPAGTLGSLTIDLPPIANIPNGPWHIDGVAFSASTTQILTALTLATLDGSAIAGTPPTTLAANGKITYTYDLTTNAWYP